MKTVGQEEVTVMDQKVNKILQTEMMLEEYLLL